MKNSNDNTPEFASSDELSMELDSEHFIERTITEINMAERDGRELFRESGGLSLEGKKLSENLFFEIVNHTNFNFTNALGLLKEVEGKILTDLANEEDYDVASAQSIIRSVRGTLVYRAHLIYALANYPEEFDGKGNVYMFLKSKGDPHKTESDVGKQKNRVYGASEYILQNSSGSYYSDSRDRILGDILTYRERVSKATSRLAIENREIIESDVKSVSGVGTITDNMEEAVRVDESSQRIAYKLKGFAQPFFRKKNLYRGAITGAVMTAIAFLGRSGGNSSGVNLDVSQDDRRSVSSIGWTNPNTFSRDGDWMVSTPSDPQLAELGYISADNEIAQNVSEDVKQTTDVGKTEEDLQEGQQSSVSGADVVTNQALGANMSLFGTNSVSTITSIGESTSNSENAFDETVSSDNSPTDLQSPKEVFISQNAPGYSNILYSPLGVARRSEVAQERMRWSNDLGDIARDIPESDMVYNLPGNRSASNYMSIINHFNVADPENGRYAPVRDDQGNLKRTFCNIYVSDVTRAMGVWLPHWIDGREMGANDYYKWLNSEHGKNQGWIGINKEQAQTAANNGIPVVGVVNNQTGSGHIWLVVPSPGDYSNLAISQAGRRNFVREELQEQDWFMQPGVDYGDITYFVNQVDVSEPQLIAVVDDSSNEVNVALHSTSEAVLNIQELKVSNTGNSETPVFFSDNYRETSNTNKEIKWVVPEEIVLHWDGNTSSSENWTTNATFNGLSEVREDALTGPRASDSHFAVGIDGVLQMLPMNEGFVRMSYGAKGYPNVINIEMGGAYFVVNSDGTTNVPVSEVENVVDLLTKLMIQYDLTIDKLVGHYQRDMLDVDGDGQLEDRGKPDPGPEFLSFIKQKVEQRLITLGIDPNTLEMINAPQQIARLP